MGTKKVDYNETAIEELPNNKPVVYKILTASGKPNYIGIAKRGRVQDRIKEHIGEIPGTKVKIEQFNSIKDAAKTEKRSIKINQPKYNKQNK